MTATHRRPTQRAATLNRRALSVPAAGGYVLLGRVGRCDLAEVNGEIALYNRYVSSTHQRYLQTFATFGDALIEAHQLAGAAGV